MVVRAERVVEIPASRERVWEFIDDPEKRARPISVVQDFELLEDGRAVWHVSLPIPLSDRTIRIETEERTRTPPEYVEFVGNSKAFRVVGEHELEEVDGVTELRNSFSVDGRVPGVERFFKKNIDSELKNLETAIKEDIGVDTDIN
ncbi:polyketide cyclase [Halovenus sp. WSH3]|uniref:Polyketide cyclase n=1 Tax=Halovenus carboxidivorans TaxID=2692199 RepID=A0A6B0T387_9EURY|nr:SRPBCC family protein [Halovenus carboxidivorans]MXR52495.1 polyketide cyclase [Halovenus carboxidivorans]